MNNKFLTSIEKKFREISEDIFVLLRMSKIFFDTILIVDKNKQLESSNKEFRNYLFSTFESYSAIAIRRHSSLSNTNRRSNSLSLIAILEKLKKNSYAINRDYYIQNCIKKYKNFSGIKIKKIRQKANIEFDNLSSSNNPNILCPIKIQCDMNKLTSKSKSICEIANKQFAHLQRYNYYDNKTTYNDLKESIELLANITEKYTLLFNDVMIDNEKLKNDSWMEIFNYPWIVK